MEWTITKIKNKNTNYDFRLISNDYSNVNFFKHSFLHGYLWFIAISIYAVPLSIYNVGSSMRYIIPITIIMLFIYLIQKERQNER